MSTFNKKKKAEATAPRYRQPRGNVKSTIEDIFPFDVPNLDTLAPQTKQYISELENQYIERYNIMINNRMIYDQIIERYSNLYLSMATELDEKGVTIHNLSELYQNAAMRHKK